MDQISGVYCVLNTINKKMYVGSSIDLVSRFRDHRYLLIKNCHYNIKLQRAWAKYGVDNFKFIVICRCEPRTNVYVEQCFIDLFDSVKNGYNIRPIAGSSLGYKFTDQQRRNVGDASRGRKLPPLSAQHRAAISQSRSGTKLSQLHKDSISKSLIAYQRTDEHNSKLRENAQTNWYKERHSQIMEAFHARKGGHSKESRERMRKSATRKLTYDQVCEIRMLREHGLSLRKIAGKFPVNASTIRDIVTGVSWVEN